MKTTLNRSLEVLNAGIKEADAVLARFAEKFASDPAYAFEWGKEAVYAAAVKRVYGRVRDALTGEGSKATPETIRLYLTEEVIRNAKSPSSSTSAISNLLDQAVLAAQAELLDAFNWRVFEGK